jgi:hypothetical protein
MPAPPFVIAGRAKPERCALPAIQSGLGGSHLLDGRIKSGHD